MAGNGKLGFSTFRWGQRNEYCLHFMEGKNQSSVLLATGGHGGFEFGPPASLTPQGSQMPVRGMCGGHLISGWRRVSIQNAGSAY